MTDKRNIVVFGSDWDVYQYAYREWIENEHIVFLSSFRASGFLGLIQRIHYNPAINRLIHLPGKPLWNHRLKKKIPSYNPCFIILENWLRLESGIRLLPYLRAYYPDAKIVCYLQDLVDKTHDLYTRQAIDIEQIKQQSDLVITYDSEDAKRYGLRCFHTVFSPIHLDQSNMPTHDVYFLGNNKGRLPLLVKLAKRFIAEGKHCAFYLSDCATEEQVEQEGIYYLHQPMSYTENLKHVMNTKSILEIVQDGAKSATFRTWEAIVLRKKLYTNNRNILQLPLEARSNIRYFKDDKDIDISFIDEEVDWEHLADIREQIRPESLLIKIEEELNCQLIR